MQRSALLTENLKLNKSKLSNVLLSMFTFIEIHNLMFEVDIQGVQKL